jgi:hypothetical protein
LAEVQKMVERAWPPWPAPGARAPLPAPRDGPPPGHQVPDRCGEGGGAGREGWSRDAEREETGDTSRGRDPAIAAGNLSRGAAGLVDADVSVAMVNLCSSLCPPPAATRPHRWLCLRRVGGVVARWGRGRLQRSLGFGAAW